MQQQANDPLDTARGLCELIVEHRQETEQQRQLAQPIVEALVQTRLGRMALTAEYGGLETRPVDALDVFETLAGAEASVAWVVWNSSLPCWFARYLEPAVREEIYRNPDWLYASSTRATGRAREDGAEYRISGRWSLVSGCRHAAWIPVTCLVEKDGEAEMLAPGVPNVRMFFVPQSSHEILDTWHVGGLRGTGSHDTVLNDEVVPRARSFSFTDPSLMDSPFGRVPIIATMSAGCASICLGIAAKSLDALIKLGMGKGPVDPGPAMRERAPIHKLVATTATKLEALRGNLRSACSALWDAAEHGDARESKLIGALFSAAVTAALECRAAVTEIYAAAGASSLYTDSPIERAHRDIHAVAQHIALQPFWLEHAGSVKFGIEPQYPLFSI